MIAPVAVPAKTNGTSVSKRTPALAIWMRDKTDAATSKGGSIAGPAG